MRKTFKIKIEHLETSVLYEKGELRGIIVNTKSWLGSYQWRFYNIYECWDWIVGIHKNELGIDLNSDTKIKNSFFELKEIIKQEA